MASKDVTNLSIVSGAGVDGTVVFVSLSFISSYREFLVLLSAAVQTDVSSFY